MGSECASPLVVEELGVRARDLRLDDDDDFDPAREAGEPGVDVTAAAFSFVKGTPVSPSAHDLSSSNIGGPVGPNPFIMFSPKTFCASRTMRG